jgi:hypothetical protein
MPLRSTPPEFMSGSWWRTEVERLVAALRWLEPKAVSNYTFSSSIKLEDCLDRQAPIFLLLMSTHHGDATSMEKGSGPVLDLCGRETILQEFHGDHQPATTRVVLPLLLLVEGQPSSATSSWLFNNLQA